MRSSGSWSAQASLNNTQGSCTARGMAREGKGKKTGGVAVGLKWYGTDAGRFLKNGGCAVPPARLRHREATCGVPADAWQSCLLPGNSAWPTEAEIWRRCGGSGAALGAFFEKRGLRRGGDDHQRGCGIRRRRAASQLMYDNHACCQGTAPGGLRPSSGSVAVGLGLLSVGAFLEFKTGLAPWW